MMGEKKTRFPALILFFLLSAAAVLLMLYAAKVYRSAMENDSRRDTALLAVTYLSEKIRQCGQDRMAVSPSGIVLYPGDGTKTIIGFRGGVLYELNEPEGTDIPAERGEALFILEGMQAKKKDGLLEITVTDLSGKTIRKEVWLYGE